MGDKGMRTSAAIGVGLPFVIDSEPFLFENVLLVASSDFEVGSTGLCLGGICIKRTSAFGSVTLPMSRMTVKGGRVGLCRRPIRGQTSAQVGTYSKICATNL